MCSGGEETVPAQEVHPELPSVWGGWGRGPKIQEHQADGVGSSLERGHNSDCRALPLSGPTPLQHREFSHTHTHTKAQTGPARQATSGNGTLCLQELTPDYSMESHQRDHENFLVVSQNRRRRGKALLDFERHDDDELGFRKNDIITVSQHLHTLKQNVSPHNNVSTRCKYQRGSDGIKI